MTHAFVAELHRGEVGCTFVAMKRPVVTEAVIAALDQIADRDRDGLIQPEVVVDEARNVQSPLHKHFDWDDGDAAMEWRLYQARNLIRQVRITRIDDGPRYVNVTLLRERGIQRRGYVRTERAVADPDLFEQVCRDAMAGIQGYRRRLTAFDKARVAMPHIDRAISALEEILPTNGREEDK